MIVKLLGEHQLEFLSLKGGCTTKQGCWTCRRIKLEAALKRLYRAWHSQAVCILALFLAAIVSVPHWTGWCESYLIANPKFFP